jgi:hypothetical protein
MLENEREAMRKAYGLKIYFLFLIKIKFIYLEMKLTEIRNDQTSGNNDLILERDSLRQENQSCKTAIDEWSKQFEEIRLANEQLTQYSFLLAFDQTKFISSRHLIEKDAYISALNEHNVNVRKLLFVLSY